MELMAPKMDFSPDIESMSGLHWVAVVLAMISAIVHLVLGLQFIPHWMGFSFLVATGGFLAGSWLVIANVKRPLIYTLGIPFTLGQIVLWIALTRPELLQHLDLTVLGPFEIVDKAAQVLLIVVLIVLLRDEW